MTRHDEKPPLSDFDLSGLPEPSDGILYRYRCSVDGFWYLETDADMALQETTGYPVGELIEYEQLGEYHDSERGDLHAIFVGGGRDD